VSASTGTSSVTDIGGDDPYGFVGHAQGLKPCHYDACEMYGPHCYSHPINEHLRAAGCNESNPDEELETVTRHLDEATAHPILREMTLYRGVQPNDRAHPMHHTEGSVHTDNGFTSTSRGFFCAADYADHARGQHNNDTGYLEIDESKDAHVLRIHAPVGTHAHNIDMTMHHFDEPTYVPKEDDDGGEVTLRKGTTWRYGTTEVVEIEPGGYYGGRRYHVTDVYVIVRRPDGT